MRRLMCLLIVLLAWSLSVPGGVPLRAAGVGRAPQQVQGQPQGLPPSPVRFTIPDTILDDRNQTPPEVGQPFQFSFCNPPMTNPNDLCQGSSLNPTGGQGPYHFQMDTMGGFPPFGMVLHPNGLLTGTPKAKGAVKFRVCAVDLAGYQNCQWASIDVQPGGGGGKKSRNGGDGTGMSKGARIGIMAAALGGSGIALGYALNQLAQMNNESNSGCDSSKAPINEINYYCFGSTRNTALCNQYIAQYDSFCKSCGYSRFDTSTGGCR